MKSPPEAPRKGDTPAKRLSNEMRGKHRLFYEGEARRAKVIEHVQQGWSVQQAVEMVGVKYDTYKHWRVRFKDFAARVDSARAGGKRDSQKEGKETGSKAFDFAQERALYFGHDSPPFQLEIVQALETLTPGNILLVLLPPEHGKTTLFEDYASLALGHDPSMRFHVGSESISLSKKILARIMGRMDPPAGSRHSSYVAKFGPFAPPKMGEDVHRQPWTQTHFDVWSKSHDERDYSMVALGFGSQIIGSRSDHLHCDDLQSYKGLALTEKNFEKWRQDWLTRPGETGKTSVMGNRVEEGDIYEAMTEELDEDILQVIRYPAILSSGEPLWPERWPLEKLDRMKRKVGVGAWDRNWQQRPRAKGQRTFLEDDVDRCLDATRPIEQTRGMEGRIAYIGVDPGLDAGTTALVAISPRFQTPGFDLVAARKHERLRSNEQIMAAIKQLVDDLKARGMHVTDVIIESKNFQAGLCRDERLLLMRDAYGFTLSDHMTGWNKYDENIGVPSMTTTFIKNEIGLPWFDDPETRHQIGELRSELLAWRPFKRGTKLRQDLVMALWFAWIKWRQRKGSDADPDSVNAFKARGLPYAPSHTGLVLPRGAYPSILAGR